MINPQTEKRLIEIQSRYTEINKRLSEVNATSDIAKLTELNKELSKISPIVELFNQHQKLTKELKEANEMMHASDDREMKELAEVEIDSLKTQIAQTENDLKANLVPEDPLADHNIFLEVRAGTGGDEAAIFAGDLFNMYARFAEKNRISVEIVSQSMADYGGFKEIIAKLSGKMVYSKLKFEAGTHRVQRVPATETQGRLHTSACTVAILPEMKKTESIQIDPKDLRIDTFRASGAGGQHVNKTDSAIRITHLPSGVVVECQEGRSQHQNKAQALLLLSSKLLAEQRRKEQMEEASERKSQVGSGDRSERIRTYNYPQGRVTDHRINLSLYNLTEVMNGSLDDLIDALTQDYTSKALAGFDH